MSEAKTIGLSDLIERVKSDLLNSESNSSALFSVDEINLTLDVAVSVDGTGEVSLSILPSWLGDTGVKLTGSATKLDTQTVQVKLTPLLSREERLSLFKAQHPDDWAEISKAAVKATVRDI